MATRDTQQTAGASKETKREEEISKFPLSPQQIAEYVEAALEAYLPGYEFYHTEGLEETPCPPARRGRKSIMEVVTNTSISINPSSYLQGPGPDPSHPYPDINLSYGQSPTEYTLYAGFARPYYAIFVYQWTNRNRVYITSPFYLSSAQRNDPVMCATCLDITQALLAPDPVAAIAVELQQLNSVSPSASPDGKNHNLNGPDFQWTYKGNWAVQFTVETRSKLYWRNVAGLSGDVTLTNAPDKLHLRLALLL